MNTLPEPYDRIRTYYFTDVGIKAKRKQVGCYGCQVSGDIIVSKDTFSIVAWKGEI